MQNHTLKIGMLGFGAMGKAHAYAVNNLAYFYGTLPFRATVAGVCTTSYERSAALAAEYGLGTAAHDFDELIARDDIDIIDICTPNTLHFDMICRALEEKKYVNRNT